MEALDSYGRIVEAVDKQSQIIFCLWVLTILYITWIKE